MPRPELRWPGRTARAGLVPAAAAAGPAFLAGISGDGTHFTDQRGQPLMVVGEDVWDIIINGGRWNGNFNTDIDGYTATRGGQGYNLAEVQMFSSNYDGADYVFTDGRDWDGTWPFAGSTDPTTTPDPAFWARRDYFFSSCAARGITVLMNASTASLGIAGCWIRSWTTTQWQAYGTFLAGRYAATPNLLWITGDDYFGDRDTELSAWLAALRAGGDTHPGSIQLYQEGTSRYDLFTGAHDPLPYGANAQFDWVYTYAPTYIGIIDACTKEPGPSDVVQGRIPAIWGDGTYYGDGTPGGNTSTQLQRNLTWWALSSGACGISIGRNGIWEWTSSSAGFVSSDPIGNFMTAQIPAIKAAFSGLPGWQQLLPDAASTLVTSGRGTPSAPLASGGSATPYTGTSDAYVTAAYVPGGSLAVIYLSHAGTIGIDESVMQPGYSAFWMDPASGVLAGTAAGPSYTSSGTNSAGDADWVLILKGP
jgi:hypothetical protein